MDTRINTRSVKIHIYSPFLTTVIGFFWAQFNSVDEADTELKLLIQAHNKEVRSQGRERGWGERIRSSASIDKNRGLEIPAEEKIPFNKTWKIQFKLFNFICSPSVSKVSMRERGALRHAVVLALVLTSLATAGAGSLGWWQESSEPLCPGACHGSHSSDKLFSLLYFVACS